MFFSSALRRRSRARQQADHFLVARLIELVSSQQPTASNGSGMSRHTRASAETAEPHARLAGANRHGDEDARRRVVAHGCNCGLHRRAGRQTIVDQNHGLAGEVQRFTSFPEQQAAALEAPAVHAWPRGEPEPLGCRGRRSIDG